MESDYAGSMLRIAFVTTVLLNNWTEASIKPVSTMFVILCLGILDRGGLGGAGRRRGGAGRSRAHDPAGMRPAWETCTERKPRDERSNRGGRFFQGNARAVHGGLPQPELPGP